MKLSPGDVAVRLGILDRVHGDVAAAKPLLDEIGHFVSKDALSRWAEKNWHPMPPINESEPSGTAPAPDLTARPAVPSPARPPRSFIRPISVALVLLLLGAALFVQPSGNDAQDANQAQIAQSESVGLRAAQSPSQILAASQDVQYAAVARALLEIDDFRLNVALSSLATAGVANDEGLLVVGFTQYALAGSLRFLDQYTETVDVKSNGSMEILDGYRLVADGLTALFDCQMDLTSQSCLSWSDLVLRGRASWETGLQKLTPDDPPLTNSPLAIGFTGNVTNAVGAVARASQTGQASPIPESAPQSWQAPPAPDCSSYAYQINAANLEIESIEQRADNQNRRMTGEEHNQIQHLRSQVISLRQQQNQCWASG